MLDLVDGKSVRRRRIIVMIVTQLGTEIFLLNGGKWLWHIMRKNGSSGCAIFKRMSAGESMAFHAENNRVADNLHIELK